MHSVVVKGRVAVEIDSGREAGGKRTCLEILHELTHIKRRSPFASMDIVVRKQ
jgi:hypothetical protein